MGSRGGRARRLRLEDLIDEAPIVGVFGVEPGILIHQRIQDVRVLPVFFA